MHSIFNPFVVLFVVLFVVPFVVVVLVSVEVLPPLLGGLDQLPEHSALETTFSFDRDELSSRRPCWSLPSTSR